MKCHIITGLLGCLILAHNPTRAVDGLLDTTFHAPDGYVLWNGGLGYDRGRDIAVQQDGKIVVTGYKTNGVDSDLMVLRYEPNGVPDTDFGTGGVYIYDSGMGDDTGLALAIAPDGKILVGGTHANGVDGDILVLRLNDDGFPDPTFSSNGVFTYDGGHGYDGAVDLQVRADGSTVVTGSTYNGLDNDLLVMRLTVEGRLDTTFNTDGVVMIDGGSGHDFGLRLAIQPNQSTVVAGTSHNGSDYDIFVVRFDPFGLVDQTFGNDGMVRLDGGDYDRGHGLGLDSKGRVLVTGLMTQAESNDTDYDIVLLRLDPNGVLDGSFGHGGLTLYDGGTREECYDLVVQCDDSILIAGHSGNSHSGISDWNAVVLKYDADGVIDTTFGSDGIFSYDPTENTEWGYALALQSDGHIVVTGQVYNGLDDDVIVLRLENSPCDVNALNEPYLIYTADHLNAIGADPNSWSNHFKLMADIDLSAYLYDRALIAPDMNDAEPGFQGKPFTGILDGNGHRISHLTVHGGSYLGLFGRIGPEATVSRLSLDGTEVRGNEYVGCIAGMHRGRITSCYGNGTVNGNRSAGVLVGFNDGSIQASCSTGVIAGGNDLGGLVGENRGTIFASYSMADVAGRYSVGGLVGFDDYGRITHSYSTGAVSGESDCGGLVGLKWGPSVIASFWDRQSSGQVNSDYGTGLSTTEMQTAKTFLDAGWDFVDETENGLDDTWRIIESQDYPRLWWEPIE